MPSGDLTPAVVDPCSGYGDGLPTGTLEWACSVGAALAAVGGWLSGTSLSVSAIGLAVLVRLPEVMAASYGSSFTMAPGDPRPFGGGWLHADLPGRDRSDFDLCMSTLPAGATAADAAAAAQEWRLTVCDYRPFAPSAPVHPLVVSGGVPSGCRGFRVLDLTAMWAGPLATWLLQGLGATVLKVEPSFRPDGFRALDGRGIHPSGRQCDPGRDSALFNALNEGKTVLDLDLRDMAAALDTAESCDLIVDNFSPRVMPNLGLSDQPAGATRVALPAFGPGPQRDWVAYGTGVHAASGLGDTGSGFAAGAVSYPDPVGGLVAALGGAAAMVGRMRGVPVGRVDTSLAAAVQPLSPGPLDRDPTVGPRLLEHASSIGLMEWRPVCGRDLLHPVSPFK